jgi:hypothetical protein
MELITSMVVMIGLDVSTVIAQQLVAGWIAIQSVIIIVIIIRIG